MKAVCNFVILIVLCAACSRQLRLPYNSQYNVTSNLNDSIWYGTGKVLRLRKTGEDPKNIKKINLVVLTDIDYPGMGYGANPNTDNGCLDPTCTRTQALIIYNIPLKKKKNRIARLDASGKAEREYSSLSYIGNSGGMQKLYKYQKDKPGWVKITRIDRDSGVVEGAFDIVFREDKSHDNILPLSETAHFSKGLFRVKMTDVLLK